MADAFDRRAFSSTAFAETADPVEAFSALAPGAQFILSKLILSDPVAASAAVEVGSFEAGVHELHSTPVAAAAFVGGSSLYPGASFLAPSHAPGGLFVSSTRALISDGERYVVVERRFKYALDGRVTLIAERIV